MNLDDVIDALLVGIPPLVSVNQEPLQGTDDYGTSQNAPFFVIGPPELGWGEGGFCTGGPTSATFPVIVVLDQNQFTTRDAPKLAIAVANAVQAILRDANIEPVRPIAYTGGSSGERPGYEIPVTMPLTD